MPVRFEQERFDLLTWNDIIYRLSHASEFGDYECISGFSNTPANWNKTNFPLLAQIDLNQVPTWKDLAMVLGGATVPFGLSNQSTSGGIRLNQAGYYYRSWGQTYGKPIGLNKPLSETKLVDTSLFKYSKSARQFRSTIPSASAANNFDPVEIEKITAEKGIVAAWYYHTSGWQFGYGMDGYKGNNPSTVLHPGVYIAVNWSYYVSGANTPYTDVDGIRINTVTTSSGAWAGSNVMFFVDSPVPVVSLYSHTNGHMQGGVYNITPPGYWNII
jgi:hypothetical protein